MPQDTGWKFIDDTAAFSLENPEKTSYLYFPLANAAGMMSGVTPTLGGDAKTGQETFLLSPVSAEDLHVSRSTRNFWVSREGVGPWSAAGASAEQTAYSEKETSRLEAGFLWHRMTRRNETAGLESEITTFVPCTDDFAELSKIVITNISDREAAITATAAVPIFGRSADRLRDHRHVTSLLQRIRAVKYGIEVTPTLRFDEREHLVNTTTYAVYGAEGSGAPPIGFFPDVERFIGEGGTLDWPQAVVRDLPPCAKEGSRVDGFEAIGGLRFRTVRLAPGERAVYLLALCIDPKDAAEKFLSERAFGKLLAQNQGYWAERLGLRVRTADRTFGLWMRWVACEPVLRRIYGCSFLPHHDYGRGGRGWRDLWQDCISLILTEREDVAGILYDNCAGMRFDGTNATIIGKNPGEFTADRNRISRVWSDHAAWPLFTVAFYLSESGNFDFLLREQGYFKDRLAGRGKEEDPLWREEDGTRLLTRGGEPYRGTILEHLLIETLTAALNVGRHSMVRLENADWNDALDMASDEGESVAFTSMYCGNLRQLAAILRELKARKGISVLSLARELEMLLRGPAADPEAGPGELREQLARFCKSVSHDVSGEMEAFAADEIAACLTACADRFARRIPEQERVSSSEGYVWLNGYYDNDGEKVEGEFGGKVRMTLTGQVFPVLFGVADDALTHEIVRSADRYLFDDGDGGYRMNTDFEELKTNLGRQFGFAYGHKENGAVFSHMAVMYANALYRRGFVREGFRALEALYRHSIDFEKSRIYPGLPEYFNPRGRGMYHYLTGSASWYVLTVVTEMFGIGGRSGDLVFTPKLLSGQFDERGEASCETLFRGKKLLVVYRNPLRLDYGEYAAGTALLDGAPLAGPVLKADSVRELEPDRTHTIEIELKRAEILER